MAEKKETGGVLEGVFAYAKIAQPDLKYQSKDTEYSIQIVVNEDAADEWDKKFKKQPAKKVKVSEFEEKFKFECPFPKEKNVYVITLKKDATKDGEPFYPEHRPRVFLETADERVDITESRLIANGSKGKVSYRINSNDFGTFAKLQNVLMDEADFIEYESQTGSAGSEFGGSEKPVKKEEARKEVVGARKPKAEKQEDAPKEKKEKKPVEQDPADDDVPF